jgi:hypothetical protein
MNQFQLHLPQSCGSLLPMALVFLFGPGPAFAWQPGPAQANATGSFVVDVTNRADVLSFHHHVYKASEGYESRMGFTGDVVNLIPGTTSQAYRDDTLRRINYYRALAGQPADVVFDPEKNQKCQESALMMRTANTVSHNPTPAWPYYTTGGAAAAEYGNIAMNRHGPGAIDAYILDEDDNNLAVGHRRWLLHPASQFMGTGDIPAIGGYASFNVNWVIGDFRTPPAASFSSWPPNGYLPVQIAPKRWSISHPNAWFGSASVSVRRDGVDVPVTITNRSTEFQIPGIRTLVWDLNEAIPSKLSADRRYEVTVSGMSGSGVPESRRYAVVFFDANDLGASPVLSGPTNPPVSGMEYTLPAIPAATTHRVLVSERNTTTWTEGAEDATASKVIDETSGAYTLRQTARKRTAAKAFQLTWPSGFNAATAPDQKFVLNRNVEPAANSIWTFYYNRQFAATTTGIYAEITRDGGESWETVWSDFGTNGEGVVNTWTKVDVPLSAYAGQWVRMRFRASVNKSLYYVGTAENVGFFIDDITMSNPAELVTLKETILPGDRTSLFFNSTLAGQNLVAGKNYDLRIQPLVGTTRFTYSPKLLLVPKAATAFETAWGAWYGTHPGLSGWIQGDGDRDGLSNLIEYAFGLNPLAGSLEALPKPVRIDGNLTLSYAKPVSVTGVTYGAQWSADLKVWNNLTNQGTANQPVFRVSTAGRERVYIRHVIQHSP